LEDVVDGLDGDARSRLRHRKDIDDVDLYIHAPSTQFRISLRAAEGQQEGETEETNGVLVYELAEHETHDFHRDTCSSVLEHLLDENM
jgi:hypothetical protein